MGEATGGGGNGGKKKGTSQSEFQNISSSLAATIGEQRQQTFGLAERDSVTSRGSGQASGAAGEGATEVFKPVAAPAADKAIDKVAVAPGRANTVLGGIPQSSGRRRQRSSPQLTLGLASSTKKKLLGQ